MIKRPSLLNDIIINSLNTYYGIRATTLTQLPLGADVNASVYKAQTDDQTSYFVKLKRGNPDLQHNISVVILNLLQTMGIQNIIPPIKTINSQLTQPLKDSTQTLIVYPFIEGQNGFHRHLTDKQWVDLGKILRQVHEINVPQSIQNQIRKETYSSKWREFVRSLYPYIESEPVGDEAALKLLKLMKEKYLLIRRLVDRAEELAQFLSQKNQNLSPKFVLCHADIHAGNVLMDGNETLYIVDWDDPIMAPKERDLMFIGGGVANVWNQPREEELFYQGYGMTEVNKTILAYYRHERIVQDIAEYGQELLLKQSRGAENSNRLEMYNEFKSMFAPGGVFDIAFQTEKDLEI